MGKRKSPTGTKKGLQYQVKFGAPAYISPEHTAKGTGPTPKEPTLKGLLGDAAKTPKVKTLIPALYL